MPRRKVADVNDYQKRLDAALAPALATPEPAAGEIPPIVEDAEPAIPVPVAPVEEQAPEPAKPKEFRPRLSGLDARTQEAIILAKDLKDQGQNISLAEAERRIGIKYGETESSAPVEDAAPVRTVADVQAEIDAKTIEADEAADGLDVKRALALQREAVALEREIARIEAAQSAQNSKAETDFARAVEASRARTVEVYAVASDPAHQVHTVADRIWADLEATGNPLVFDQNAPFKVYQMAFNELGIAPGKAVTAAPAVPVKSLTSATPKPQSVIQSAVRRPNPAVPVASGGDRTTNGPTPTVTFGKSRSPHEYGQKLKSLGLSGV